MIFLDLLIGFLEVGLFSFGGAYAAIPLIRDVVLAHGWLDDEMLSYMIAVSESTPGPIMVNLATYVGSNKGGLAGALIATTVVMLPAFLFILFVMAFSKSLVKNPYLQAALRGLKPCVIGVILATGVYMIIGNCYVMTKSSVDFTAVLITCFLALIYFGSRKVIKKGLSPIGLICIAALVGLSVYGI
ncbi:MAG: chromate transporter [Clostridia bacterium]|nr:chromate transporter [Clostridia bacterium]